MRKNSTSPRLLVLIPPLIIQYQNWRAGTAQSHCLFVGLLLHRLLHFCIVFLSHLLHLICFYCFSFVSIAGSHSSDNPAAIFIYRHASSLRIHAFTVTCLLTNFNVKIRSRHIYRQCIQLTHSFTYSNLSFTYWLILDNIPNIRSRHTYKTYILIHSLLTQLLIRNTRSISHSKRRKYIYKTNLTLQMFFLCFLQSSNDIRTNPELHFLIENYCNVWRQRQQCPLWVWPEISVEEITSYLLAYL